MAQKKIPVDAFEFYFSLGPGRSYRAVADQYGVSKTAVANAAEREQWQKRLNELEQKAHEAAEKRITESLEQMAERHVKMYKLIQRKALEALKSMPLNTAIEAVRALDVATKNERLARGEPSDRTAVSMEDVIRKEYDRWMTDEGEEVENNNAEYNPNETFL